MACNIVVYEKMLRLMCLTKLPRRHNRQLTPKINKLYDSNFVQCMLYKDLY